MHQSRRIAEELNEQDPGSALWANQFDNVANREYHEATTAQEIWDETNGAVDAFICAVGTGGTLAGISRGLKAHSNRQVKIGISDPTGSALYNYFTSGELKAEGGSISEGIGTSRITDNFADTIVDIPYQIPGQRIDSARLRHDPAGRPVSVAARAA